MFTFNHVIIPSGIHLGLAEQPIAYGLSPIPYIEGESPFQGGFFEICNPMPVRPVPEIVVEEVKPLFERELRERYRHTPVVSRDQLRTYGGQLLDLGKTLNTTGYDALLVPLRGGLKPWVQLEVIGEMRQKPLWVPFTGGSSKKYDEQILWQLDQNLSPMRDGNRVRIGLIDTSIGGQSSYHLAELLRKTRGDEGRCQWEIDFHLLHDQAQMPEGVREIPRMSTEMVYFNPVPWPVDGLIVEDWNEAIGLEAVVFEGKKVIIKNCSTEGRIILKDDDGTVRLIESPELHHYVDTLLADAISTAVAKDPLLEFQHDVWQRYTTR